MYFRISQIKHYIAEDKNKHQSSKKYSMDLRTSKLIKEFSPTWTNKQIWEFEQINENLRFDFVYVKPGYYNPKSWKSKLAFPDSEIRNTTVQTFDNLINGNELWVANRGQSKFEKQHIQYLMAVMADIMIEEEICLNFRVEDNCLVVSIDSNADVIDCKEFFEEFYHLATGFNYDVDTGIPEDETEAELYLTRLQEEFDDKMKARLGDKYLPGNNDPDTINSK